MYPGAITECDICFAQCLDAEVTMHGPNRHCPKCEEYRLRRSIFDALQTGDPVRILWHSTEYDGTVVAVSPCWRAHRFIRFYEDNHYNGRVSHELTFNGPDSVELRGYSYGYARMLFG